MATRNRTFLLRFKQMTKQQYSRRISSTEFPMPIIVTKPAVSRSEENVAVVLCGFAGSKYKHLEKHSLMYNDLGYKTIHCVMPMEYTFTYDIDNIRRCSRELIDKVVQENVSKMVTVCFSNNGALLYQHMLPQLGPGDPQILGTVFDSAPGPMLGHAFWFLPDIISNPPAAPDKLSLILGQIWINAANRIPLKHSLRAAMWQMKNFKSNPSIPWPSHYFKYQDTSSWPKLFIYSEGKI